MKMLRPEYQLTTDQLLKSKLNLVQEKHQQLLAAAWEGRIDDVKLFSSDCEQTVLSEALWAASWWGHVEIVKWMVVNTSVDVNFCLSHSSTVLTYACANGQLDVVNWLVQLANVDVNWRDKKGRTPLTAACESKRLNLMIHQNDLYSIEPDDVLHTKSYYVKDKDRKLQLDIIKCLLETRRVDVNLPGQNDQTPLIKTCFSGFVSASLFLLRESDHLCTNIADANGNTALHYAIWCGESGGDSKLHMVCYSGQVQAATACQLAMTCSQNDINNQNNYGDTPLHVACRRGDEDVVMMLMLMGADETITNDWKQTPYQLAKTIGHDHLFDMLDRVIIQQVMFKRKAKRTAPAWRTILVAYQLILVFMYAKIKAKSKRRHLVGPSCFEISCQII